jgi:hypothetical protein
MTPETLTQTAQQQTAEGREPLTDSGSGPLRELRRLLLPDGTASIRRAAKAAGIDSATWWRYEQKGTLPENLTAPQWKALSAFAQEVCNNLALTDDDAARRFRKELRRAGLILL